MCSEVLLYFVRYLSKHRWSRGLVLHAQWRGGGGGGGGGLLGVELDGDSVAGVGQDGLSLMGREKHMWERKKKGSVEPPVCTYLHVGDPEVVHERVEEDPVRVDVDGRLAPTAVAQAPVRVDQAPEGRTCKIIPNKNRPCSETCWRGGRGGAGLKTGVSNGRIEL